MIQLAIHEAINGRDLDYAIARATMEEMMDGTATDIEMATLLTALRMKGETITEITACAEVMREKGAHIEPKGAVMDIVGTGGDEVGSFNISTTAAFVAAAGGVPVAKHGNRSVSSKSGAADVLEELGVVLSLTPEQKLSRDWAAGAQAGEMLGAVLRACSQEPVVVLDTGGAVENAGADKTADRIQIANTLGALLKRLLDDGLESTVLIMGGDCLLGLMRQLDATEIMPLCEVAPGVVLSQFTYGGRQWNLVSKSGGFGAKTLFYDLQNILERWKKELPAV